MIACHAAGARPGRRRHRRAGARGRRAAARRPHRGGRLALRTQLPSGLSLTTCERVDCRGLVVAPGFIDAHTHDDAIVLAAPEMLPKMTQGVTTVVTGQLRHLARAIRGPDEPQAAAQACWARSFRLSRRWPPMRKRCSERSRRSTWRRSSATRRCASRRWPTSRASHAAELEPCASCSIGACTTARSDLSSGPVLRRADAGAGERGDCAGARGGAASAACTRRTCATRWHGIIDALHEAGDTAFARRRAAGHLASQVRRPGQLGPHAADAAADRRAGAAPTDRDGRVPVRRRLHGAARGSGRRRHRRAGQLVGAASGDDGPACSSAIADEWGVDSAGGLPTAQAGRRLLLPDARGRCASACSRTGAA